MKPSKIGALRVDENDKFQLQVLSAQSEWRLGALEKVPPVFFSVKGGCFGDWKLGARVDLSNPQWMIWISYKFPTLEFNM